MDSKDAQALVRAIDRNTKATLAQSQLHAEMFKTYIERCNFTLINESKKEN